MHTPAVLALDERLGALLLEGIEPGTPLVVSSTYPDPAYPTVAQRVADQFDASTKLYQRHPELMALVPPDWNWRAKETAPARVPRRSWGSLDRRQPTSGS